MSPDRVEQIGFTLDQNVRSVMDTLRKADLAWIADEIGDAVLADWLGARETVVTNLAFPSWKEDRTVPESGARGQEIVTLLVLRSYFVDLFDVWKESGAQLREALGEKRLEIQIALPEAVHPETIFDPEYEKAASEFGKTLRQSLPVSDEAEEQ